MYAFRVKLNDGKPIVGGASDLGVLTANITAVGKLGPTSNPRRGDDPVDISLRLGGLTSRGKGIPDEHLVWFETDDLMPGDKIYLEIIETDTPDPVERGEQAKQRADDERAYFEHCKRGYYEMKDKYEGSA